jgi:CRISPR-associated protein Cmr6
MANSDDIPLMFQAQVSGRSQIQKIEDLKKTKRSQQQAYDWVDQWRKGCDAGNVPIFDKPIQTSEDTSFTWRMVTNSGQDGGVIRPVIGERGWAYFPGSSMKGAFRRACTSQAERLRYCGSQHNDVELHPGILRFHGGYPKNVEWLDSSLVDVVHPQEDWQVKDGSSHSALVQISLYKPTLIFGISCTTIPENDPEWTRIWEIWQIALERGIGSRVSAGYGQIKIHKKNKLLTIGLQGQGLTSKRIDNVGEFRPNIFKAALRGHTRRLFSGLTDDVTAERLTKYFWGGFEKKGVAELGDEILRGNPPVVAPTADGVSTGALPLQAHHTEFQQRQKKDAIIGLLGIAFTSPDLFEDVYEYQDNTKTRKMPVYDTDNSSLHLLMMQKMSDEHRKTLGFWTTQLVKFAMLLGGFGKSWRRVDHRLFSHSKEFPRYLTNSQSKNINPMIGCHWQFVESSISRYIPVEMLEDITNFLDNFYQVTKTIVVKKDLDFLKKSIYAINPPSDNIREAWRKGNVEVWGRIAKNAGDCHAIAWFHRAYQGEQSIKTSELTGWSSNNDRQPKTQIGRIWHRMYPRYLKRDEELIDTGEYVELLTIFPNRSGNEAEVQKTINFLKFLKDSSDFTQLW